MWWAVCVTWWCLVSVKGLFTGACFVCLWVVCLRGCLVNLWCLVVQLENLLVLVAFVSRFGCLHVVLGFYCLELM